MDLDKTGDAGFETHSWSIIARLDMLEVKIDSANKQNAGVIETFTLLRQPSMSWLHADMKNIYCFNRMKNDD